MDKVNWMKTIFFIDDVLLENVVCKFLLFTLLIFFLGLLSDLFTHIHCGTGELLALSLDYLVNLFANVYSWSVPILLTFYYFVTREQKALAESSV